MCAKNIYRSKTEGYINSGKEVSIICQWQAVGYLTVKRQNKIAAMASLSGKAWPHWRSLGALGGFGEAVFIDFFNQRGAL